LVFAFFYSDGNKLTYLPTQTMTVNPNGDRPP
jgi:hypothetical protein